MRRGPRLAAACWLCVATACAPGVDHAGPTQPGKATYEGAGRVLDADDASRVEARLEAGCEDDCGGSAGPELVEDLKRTAKQAELCYLRALDRRPKLSGKFVVGLQLSRTGGVCGARVLTDELKDPELRACVIDLFRDVHYAAPTDGCIDVAVPLAFKLDG